MRFAVGDRLVIVNEFIQSQERMLEGLVCTVLIAHKTRGEYGVEWDELPPWNAHSLDNRAKTGYGWWFGAYMLENNAGHETPAWEL